MKKIEIKCKSADTLKVADFSVFQGDLKKISKENMKKLKNNIIKEGFVAPIFIWLDGVVFNILDGTTRIKALRELLDDGYEIPEIPISYIYADNEKDARKKLLQITSQYGTFELEELNSWLEDFDAEFAESLRITDEEIDLSAPDFEDEDYDSDEIDYQEKYEIIVTCNNESELQKLYNDFNKRGLNCKVSTL